MVLLTKDSRITMTKEVSMLFHYAKRMAVGLFVAVAVFGFVVPASYAIGAENQASAQAAKIASQLTPAQLATVAKLNAKTIAMLAKMDRGSLATVAKLDARAIGTVAKMDRRAFNVVASMDRGTLATVAKLDSGSLAKVAKLDRNSIGTMAKLDNQGKLPARNQQAASIDKKAKKAKNSYF